MPTLILPGKSEKNKRWLDEYSKVEDAVRYSYLHWGISNQLNFDKEFSQLEQISQEYDIDKLIAKGAGVAISLYAIDRGIFKPKRSIFMGFPLKWAKKKRFGDDLIRLARKYNNITYIQQRTDPQCSPGIIPSKLNKPVFIIEGKNQWYSYDDVCEYL